MKRAAIIEGEYRYKLRREWNPALPCLGVNYAQPVHGRSPH